MYDLIAKPYCLFNFSASSSEILNTICMSLVMLSPPRGIVFVYSKAAPSNIPISVFPAPMSIIITLSFNSLLSSIKFLSASVIGIIPSISNPAFLQILDNCLMYSLSPNITCAFKENVDTKFPTGSSTARPSSKTNLSVTISIILFPSGTSISFTCKSADDTSLVDIPAYLSFIVFVTLFCTIVT